MSDVWIMVIILATVFVGAMLQSVFGFGFSLILMAVLPFVIGINRAIIYNLMLAFISNVIIGSKLFRKICWKELIPMLIPTLIICSVTAVWAVKLNTVIMYFLMGCMLFGTSVYFLAFNDKIKINATVKSGVIVGTICGFLGGLFSLAGPTAAMYLLPAVKDKEKFTATIQAFFLMMNIVNLITRILMGTMVVTDIPGIAMGAVVLIGATFIGLKLGDRLKNEWFTRGVYTLIGLNGIWIIIANMKYL